MSAVSVLDPHAARAVFDAACALAWADGELLEPELRAIRGLALALGLADVVAATEDAIAQRRILPSRWRLARLEPRARVIALAAASWLALADADIDPREAEMLEELRERLGLAPATARFARAHAAWATATFEGEAPHRAASRLLVEGARRTALITTQRAAA